MSTTAETQTEAGLARTEIAHRVRVRYAECDPMNVAHHGSYAAWLEEARTELLRAAGGSYAAMEQSGLILVITKMEIRYRRPIQYDDVIEVRCTHVPAGQIKIRHQYELVLVERMGEAIAPGPESSLAAATTELACLNAADKRPTRLPRSLVVQNHKDDQKPKGGPA